MLLEKFNPIIPAEDDGFTAENAFPWTLRKNKIIQEYLQVFTSTMRRKFNYLVYLDLFAGSGLKKIDNSQYTYGAPIMALDDSNGFAKHIFCEPNSSKSEALRIRVNKYYRHKNVVVFSGDPNKMIDRLEYYIPESTEKYKVSTICLIDLLSFDVEFDTVKLLSDLGVNFLVLLSLPWEGIDNFQTSTGEERELLNAFLGKPLSECQDYGNIANDEQFFRFMVKNYHMQLKELGYSAKGSFYAIEASEMSIPYFFAGYYSNNKGARKIHSDVLKKVVHQIRLFE